MNRLIGICGAAGSGKSTVAKFLVDQYGFDRLRFADGLKRMSAALFEVVGFEQDEIHRMLEGDLKQVRFPELMHASPRDIMQTLGTEWGRECIHPDIWVNITQARVLDTLAENIPVVVDDVRHINEAEMIRSLGGEIWKIRGRGLEGVSNHSSEHQFSSVKADEVIYNGEGGIEMLHDQIRRIVERNL